MNTTKQTVTQTPSLTLFTVYRRHGILGTGNSKAIAKLSFLLSYVQQIPGYPITIISIIYFNTLHNIYFFKYTN